VENPYFSSEEMLSQDAPGFDVTTLQEESSSSKIQIGNVPLSLQFSKGGKSGRNEQLILQKSNQILRPVFEA
jgi:hypothetical protein